MALYGTEKTTHDDYDNLYILCIYDIQKMNEKSLVKKKMSVIWGEVKTAAYHRE